MSTYLQATCTRGWSPIGQTPYLFVTPQRDHLHFYGALDVLTGQAFALALPRMDAEATLCFIQHLLACLPNRPILFLLHLAPWHKGPVRHFIEAHPSLEMLYFPPGSPHLNPQEHVWKQTRQAGGHLHQWRDLSQLRQAFQHFLESTTFHFHWIEKFLPLPLSYASDFLSPSVFMVSG